MSHVQGAEVAAPLRYDFRAMTPADLDLVARWLKEPHVARWWPDGEGHVQSITEHLTDPSMRCLILTVDGRDVGYLQIYDPNQGPWVAPDGTPLSYPYGNQPPGTRGIDLFIGEAGLVGCGHGPHLIGRVLRDLFDEGAPRVVTDPDPANAYSIAAFRKAGFRTLGNRETGWERVLLMRCDNPERAPTP